MSMVRGRARDLLAERGVPVTVAENVLPRIGVLEPGSARAAIREVFLRHVIGGKRLSRGSRFAGLVRAATPDVVLTGVELLADSLGGDLLVVDVGGATTDVYSVLTPDERAGGPSRPVAGTMWRARTVEGDLGMRWSAPGVLRAAAQGRLLADGEQEVLSAAVARRAADPGYLVGDEAERAVDVRIAGLAATIAVRRHAGGGGAGQRGARDLRDVRLLIGSGGVLRHAGVVGAGGGAGLRCWRIMPVGGGCRGRRGTLVDVDYVLASGGLLAVDQPVAAEALLRRYLTPV